MNSSHIKRKLYIDLQPQVVDNRVVSLLFSPFHLLSKKYTGWMLRQIAMNTKMRWTPSNLMSGLQGLFKPSVEDDGRLLRAALDDIRQAMLDCLGASGAAAYPQIQFRVAYASDLQELWYLRGDVMAVISAMDGEATARRKLARISDMFKGHLPKGLATRPSPLGD